MGKKRWTILLKRLPKFTPLVGVEVGVLMGSMSWELLQRPELFLWLVDIEPRLHALEVTKFAEGRRDAIWLPSVEAAKKFEDKSLDFVFIDADHSYEAVRADIGAWKPKIKPGGLLCGHDHSENFPGVVRAVKEGLRNVELDLDKTWFARL
jgi:predicted O-methyltransferase YrrM